MNSVLGQPETVFVFSLGIALREGGVMQSREGAGESSL